MTALDALALHPLSWHQHVQQVAAEGSIPELEASLVALPETGAVMARRAQLLMRRRRYTDAIELLAEWQTHPLCLAVTALALTGLGDVKACRRVLKEFTDVPGEPTDLLHVEAHYRLRYARGLAHSELQALPAAIMEFQVASGIAVALGFAHVALAMRLEVAELAWKGGDWDRALLELTELIPAARAARMDTLRRRALELSIWVTLMQGKHAATRHVRSHPEGLARRILMAGAALLDGEAYTLPALDVGAGEHRELLTLLHALNGMRLASFERCAGNFRAAQKHVARVRALSETRPNGDDLTPSHDPLYRNLFHLCLALAQIQGGDPLEGQAMIVGRLPAPQIEDHPLVVAFRACAALEAMIWSERVPDSRRYPLTRATAQLAMALNSLPPAGRARLVRLLGEFMPESLLLLSRSEYGAGITEVASFVAGLLVLDDRAVSLGSEPLQGYQRELPSAFRGALRGSVLGVADDKRLQRYRSARKLGPDAHGVVSLPDVTAAVMRALEVASPLESLSWQRFTLQ